jgi:hypothetical protein
MAGRIRNRRELRKQTDQAEQAEGAGATPTAAPRAKRKPAAPKAKKARKPKEAPRQRVRWGVFDGGMKQVAIFDYKQRAAADQKVLELNTRKKGDYFLQMVKEPMPDPAPAASLGVE